MLSKWKACILAASICAGSIAVSSVHAAPREDLLRSIIVLKNMAISGAKTADFMTQMTSVSADFEISEKNLNKTQHSLVKNLVDYGRYDVLTLRDSTGEKSSLTMCALHNNMRSDPCRNLYYSAAGKMGMAVTDGEWVRISTTDNATVINLILNDMALRSLQQYSEKASAGLKK